MSHEFVVEDIFTYAFGTVAEWRLGEAWESPLISCFHSLKVKGRACVLGKAITSSTGDSHRRACLPALPVDLAKSLSHPMDTHTDTKHKCVYPV